jgi:hypothetical protein
VLPDLIGRHSVGLYKTSLQDLVGDKTLPILELQLQALAFPLLDIPPRSKLRLRVRVPKAVVAIEPDLGAIRSQWPIPAECHEPIVRRLVLDVETTEPQVGLGNLSRFSRHFVISMAHTIDLHNLPSIPPVMLLGRKTPLPASLRVAPCLFFR